MDWIIICIKFKGAGFDYSAMVIKDNVKKKKKDNVLVPRKYVQNFLWKEGINSPTDKWFRKKPAHTEKIERMIKKK